MKIGFISHLDANLYRFRLPVMIELQKRGWEVYAISPKGDYFDKFEALGMHAVSYEITRASLNPLRELKTLNALYHTLLPLQLDIVHNFTVKPNIYGSFAARKAKVDHIINTVTGMGSFYIDQSMKAILIKSVIEGLYRTVNRFVDKVVFQNNDDHDYFLKKSLIKASQGVVIKSSGIDTQVYDRETISLEKIEKLKEEIRVEGRKVVLMVARAIWHKGIREYYEAAHNLVKRRTDTLFLFVGDTDEGNPSCASRDFLETSYVKWLGHREDIAELTALCDVYVLPSYREGVPRTLLEASSMGKAMVTTDTIGCREVVQEGVNGLLVPVQDALALEKGIEKLLEDEVLRERLGTRAREKALEEFDVKKVTDRYVSLYESVIGVEDETTV